MQKKHIKQLVMYLCAIIAAISLLSINKLISEIVLLLILIVWSAHTFLVIKSQKEKNGTLTNSPIAVAVSLLIILYILLHLLFCYQFGYPASIQQTENDLTLQSSDWLGFLGNYLSFAGSLVMAYFVYRQGKIINDFAVSEYIPAIGISIVGVRPFENNSIPDLLQVGSDSESYYTLFPIPTPDSSFECEEYGMLLFSNITNYSKSILHDFTFCSLEIKEISSGIIKASYSIPNSLDPSNYAVTLFPNNVIKRCFAIKKIPAQFDISVMTITFSSKKQPLMVNILVSKRLGEELHFVNI